jgi:hypothetical protein
MKSLNGNSKTTMAVLLVLGLAALALADSAFRFFGPMNRILTPNSNVNRLAILCFDNPSDSDASGAIYTMFGAHVADLSPRQSAAGTACPSGALPGSTQYVTWDGRSNGAVVHSGVYIYQVRAEGQSFTGTLLVVR